MRKNKMKSFRLASTVSVLVFLTIAAVVVPRLDLNFLPKARVKNIIVCPKTYRGTCAFKGGDGLQKALSSLYKNSGNVKITIKNGVYTRPAVNVNNTSKKQTVKQLDHNTCSFRNHTTTFKLSNATNVTIRGESKSGTILLGDAVHGFTVLDSKNITLDNITFASNGGVNDNGIGDGTLNIQNSTGTLKNSIITANSTRSNPRRGDGQRDQEGIHLYGPKTLFTIFNNLVVDNYHTGIMLEDGADAFIYGNLIMRNGIAPLYNKTGHGITSYDNVDERKICDSKNKPYFNPDHWIRAWNNIVTDNSGHGLYIRGRIRPFNYEGKSVGIGLSHNTLANNRKGVAVGAGYGTTNNNTFIDGGSIYIGSNLIIRNSEHGVWLDPDRINTRGNAKIYLYNNDSIGSGSSSKYNYYLPNKYTFVSKSANLQKWPQKNQYYQLTNNSPLKNAGRNQTDISSYDNKDGKYEFKRSLYTTMLKSDYAKAKNKLANYK